MYRASTFGLNVCYGSLAAGSDWPLSTQSCLSANTFPRPNFAKPLALARDAGMQVSGNSLRHPMILPRFRFMGASLELLQAEHENRHA